MTTTTTRSASRSRWVRGGIGAASLGLVLTGVVAFAVAAAPEPVEREVGPGIEPLPILVRTIEPLDGFDVVRSFSGRVEARRSSEVGFELAGLVAEVLVDEGDHVDAGDPVARLDTARLDARRRELIAALDAATARSEQSGLVLERMSKARASGAATRQELDDAIKEAAAAEADRRLADATVVALDVDLEKAVLHAPFDAIVARRDVDPGQVVAAAMPIVRLDERSPPRARIGVGGRAVDALTVGDTTTVSVDGGAFDAEIIAILPVRDAAARGVDVILEIDGRLGSIRTGDLARIDVSRRVDERVVALPRTALSEGVRGLWTVYVLEEPGDAGIARLRRNDVAVVHQSAETVFVTGVLPRGTRVAIDGLHRVVDGMDVRPVAEETGP